jgi:hypothetical protein
MSKSLIRKNQLHPDINDLVGQYGSGYFSSNNSTVFITGNQTIGGKKTFATGIVSPLGIGNPGDLSDAEIQLWETSSESYQSIGSVDGGFTFTRGGIEMGLEFNSEEIVLAKSPGIAYRFKSGYNGTVPIDANVLHVTGGNETISGVKTFANSGIFNSGIDLRGSKLVNFTPEITNVVNNFNISGLNTKIIMANSSTLITGTLTSGNISGFNTSIIQVGTAQIQITGAGAGIKIDSYNNQYRTAGQFATISLLHTGNNGYIMYGNTST